MNNEITTGKKLNSLYVILSSIFISNVILAELIGMKIFSLSKLFGIQTELPMSCGILIWPLVFILSDIINEYFGRKGVQKISILAAILIAYALTLVLISTHLPPADFWMAKYGKDFSGNPLLINDAYSIIFRQGINIIIGSITAFLISQMIDVYAFHYIRKITGHKKLWLRATGSTVISQVIDSFVVLFVAFYLLGGNNRWTFREVMTVGTMQYIYKISFAILLTPVIYLVHYVIDKYLGKKGADVVIEETDKNW